MAIYMMTSDEGIFYKEYFLQGIKGLPHLPQSQMLWLKYILLGDWGTSMNRAVRNVFCSCYPNFLDYFCRNASLDQMNRVPQNK